MKKTFLLSAALVLAAFIAACGATPTPAPTEPATPTQTPPPPTDTPVPTNTSVPTTEAPAATEVLATEAAAESTVSFAANVYPILEAKCIKCHGVEQVKEGLKLLTYDDLMTGSFNGPVIVPGNADESLLVQLIVRGKMPNRGPKATDEELQIIRDWVNQGALNN